MKTKHLLLSFLLVACSLFCFSQTSKEDKENQTLRIKNKVHITTVTQSDYKMVNGKWIAGTPYKINKCKYDANGNQIEEINYNQKGTIETWVVYDLDKFGNFTKMTNKNSDGSTAYITKWKNEYDSLNRVKQIWVYKNDTVAINRVNYWYDEKGNMITTGTFKPVYSFKNSSDQNGTLTDKVTLLGYEDHTYDEKGRTILIEYYDSNKNYQSKTTFKYDAYGKMIEQVSDYVYTQKYGANGLLIEYTAYDNKNRPISKWTITYEYAK